MKTSLALQTKDDDDVLLEALYDQDDEQAQMLVIFERRYRGMLRAVHEVVRDAFAGQPDFDPDTFRLDDEATREVLEQAAERVVRIDETTRKKLIERLQEGQQRGLSSWQIAYGDPQSGFAGIEGLFEETWAGRAETVSRTEMAESQRLSAINRYQATGLVDRVQLIDGDYDEPCAQRNGRVVPLAQTPGLNHPNCTLVLVPLLREGT
jgi:AcrR family transcriptional regulator